MALNIRIQPQQPSPATHLAPKICIFGVGGGGVNSVNNMVTENIEGVELFACNSDAQSLDKSLCPNKIQLGPDVTGGLGAGARPEVGRAAAEESLEEVMNYIRDANMVFITAGMGGGTGTGAAPIIAKACREQGILTVGVVTKPFHFEGTHRMRVAEAGIEEMQQYVDTLIVIPNQNLFRVANEKTTFAEAFKMADSVLQSGVRGVTDLMVMPGLINLDFADIRSAMLDQGKAMLGTGEASGERRAIEAAEAAINNPLLDDVSMKGAKGVIINITGGYDMTLFEADEACNRIRDEVDPEANIIFGSTFDETMDGVIRVSVIATGIDQGNKAKRPSGNNFDFNKIPATRLHNQKTAPALQQPQAETVKATAELQEQQAERTELSAPAVAQAAPAPSRTPFTQATGPEQQRTTATTSSPSTTPRATRYNDSFIPPAPVEIEKNEYYAQTAAYQPTPAPVSRPVAPVAPAENAPATPQSGYTLRPPVPATTSPSHMTDERQRRTGPSFLERITTLTQTVRGGNHAGHPSSPAQPPVPQTPMQGSLAIDTPSAKPQARDENDLDIPAFLRRQAN
ncbi:MAG: cell division protein FtsZ [Rhodospirillales bacterium]|nr:cell division protein FtsZ [Rhodospirillales bacterium]MCB9979713.1 cell division protein FtsZ [Rhodospirillales bacterium]